MILYAKICLTKFCQFYLGQKGGKNKRTSIICTEEKIYTMCSSGTQLQKVHKLDLENSRVLPRTKNYQDSKLWRLRNGKTGQCERVASE